MHVESSSQIWGMRLSHCRPHHSDLSVVEVEQCLKRLLPNLVRALKPSRRDRQPRHIFGRDVLTLQVNLGLPSACEVFV